MPVEIHGKQYVTVAERVAAFHEALNGEARIETEIVAEDEKYVTVRAQVWTTPTSCFTGHARSDKTDRSIEGQSPLEVAETSAIGRALGFAGFGVVEGIATADEVKAAQRSATPVAKKQPIAVNPSPSAENAKVTPDTPEKAALRKLYALAKEKDWDEGGLKAFLGTDSLRALAQHMTAAAHGPAGTTCTCGKPHNLKDEAAGYRVMIDLVSEAG